VKVAWLGTFICIREWFFNSVQTCSAGATMQVTYDISTSIPLQYYLNQVILLYTVQAMSVSWKLLQDLEMMNDGLEKFAEDALKDSGYTQAVKNEIVQAFVQVEWQKVHNG